MAPTTRSKKGKEKKDEVPGNSTVTSSTNDSSYSIANIKECWTKYGNVEFGKKVLFDPEYTWVVAALLFLAEVFINSFIVITRSCKKFLPICVFITVKHTLLDGEKSGLIIFLVYCRHRNRLESIHARSGGFPEWNTWLRLS